MVSQPEPVAPTQPMTPQPVSPNLSGSFAPEPTPPVEQSYIPTAPAQSSGKNPLLYVGLVMFFLVLGGATYYALQPQQEAGKSNQQVQQVTYTTPEPTAIPTLSEEQELDTAVSYSLDESFAELEKDLQQL